MKEGGNRTKLSWRSKEPVAAAFSRVFFLLNSIKVNEFFYLLIA